MHWHTRSQHIQLMKHFDTLNHDLRVKQFSRQRHFGHVISCSDTGTGAMLRISLPQGERYKLQSGAIICSSLLATIQNEILIQLFHLSANMIWKCLMCTVCLSAMLLQENQLYKIILILQCLIFFSPSVTVTHCFPMCTFWSIIFEDHESATSSHNFFSLNASTALYRFKYVWNSNELASTVTSQLCFNQSL